ncbi:MAG: RagB/SusD family nutrient uptake outer membrane protein [Flavobacteriaceae bacterium]
MKLKYILYLTLAVTFSGCEDVLDKEPLDRISEVAVWQDQRLADAYLTDVYARANFRHLHSSSTGLGLISAMADEMIQFAPWQQPNAAIATPMNSETLFGPLNYWRYNDIRKLNIFIDEVGSSEAFDQEYKSKRLGEARWLRAYFYFNMVIRYGGIPLITTAQSLDDDEETLFVSRNTEKEIYDFVDTEMSAIFNDLPDAHEGEPGRVSKWAAKALQSRSNLYAGSIARFGEVQLNGVVGIPASDESSYWQKSYNASKELIDNSPHSLYNTYPDDPMLNHKQLFVDEIENNPEVIFTERFDAASTFGHHLSVTAVHADFAFAWNSNFRPYLDIAEKFEFIDGTSGEIPRDQYATKEWTMDELFHNRDPRFKAAFLYNESDFWGKKAYFHEKSIVDGAEVKSGVLPDGTPAKASNRSFEPRPKPLRQGFLLRKFLDESPGEQQEGGQSSEDYHIFRLGETYLNLAEAAFYLGKTGEALAALNTIRARAGMPAKASIDEEVIRNERAVELVFEEHRFWDLRRWRIAEEVLNETMHKGLSFIYNHDTKKYKISVKNAIRSPRVFLSHHYYYPLTLTKLSDNPNLVENPGY